MAIQTTNRSLRPRDRKIDARMKILGVLGFLLLAAAFSVGLFVIGPRWGSSRHAVKPPDAASAYTPSQRMPAQEETGHKPDLKLEVTEEGVDAPNNGEPSQNATAESGSSNDIRKDESGLTITLDAKDRQSSTGAGEPNTGSGAERNNSATSTPKDPGHDKPAAGSSLEKPRAATEQHSSTAAPARD